MPKLNETKSWRFVLALMFNGWSLSGARAPYNYSLFCPEGAHERHVSRSVVKTLRKKKFIKALTKRGIFMTYTLTAEGREKYWTL